MSARAALQQVLGGFVNMRIVGVRLDSLFLEVENVHPRYPDVGVRVRGARDAHRSGRTPARCARAVGQAHPV